MLYIPKGYKSSLDLIETQETIKKIKDFFQNELAKKLNLIRVSAPIFVTKESGLNDELSGKERPVSFDFKSGNSVETAEVVQSLAKWKRHALKRYNFYPGKGLYTDMNAIRADELLDNTHSLYVDQWDWEKVIRQEDRSMEYLITTVGYIYDSFVNLDIFLENEYEKHFRLLPDEITFITSQELENLYPDLPPQEREEKITKDKKAVFISQIGKKLKSGKPHDDRAPDYDDWDLNGDILFWNPVLDSSLEMSSMGIRVSPESLLEQLTESDTLDKLSKPYHKMLSEGNLPYSIGGGIGQSRMCMYFMQKAHIGEVQASIWPKEVLEECKNRGIVLL